MSDNLINQNENKGENKNKELPTLEQIISPTENVNNEKNEIKKEDNSNGENNDK